MTRALIAFDGSPSAYLALDLAASLAWPAGSEIRLVSVLSRETDLVDGYYGPWFFDVPASHPDLRGILMTDALDNLEQVAGRFRRPGVAVTNSVLTGTLAEALCADAKSFGAELIIVGSRGHGALTNALLGSVSAALVDNAGCPVLVARTSAVRHILLGADGSPASLAACDLVTSPLFGGAPVTAAAVADTRWPWWVGASEAGGMAGMPAPQATVEATQAKARADAGDVLEALAARVRTDEMTMLEGDPAAALLVAAAEREIDLVAVGSRGRKGLQRLVLGSVSRNVLLHAPCSVLIAHAPRKA